MTENKNLKPGDIVLVHYRNKFYAKVLKVEQRFYDEEDVSHHLSFNEQRGDVVDGVCQCGHEYCPKLGQRYGDLVTFEKVYDYDFKPTTRKLVNTYDEAWMTKVDDEMIRQKEAIMLESLKKLKDLKL